MRIAIDALSVVPRETGGGETYLRGLLAALGPAAHERGHAVSVYCSDNNAALFDGLAGLTLRTVPLDNRSRVRRLLYEHLRFGQRLAADGVEVLFAPGNALPLRVPCASVLGVQSMHSFLVPQEMSRFRVAYFRHMVPRSARRADRVLCVSEDLKRTLLRETPGLDEANVRVVYEGAPEDARPVEDAQAVARACAQFDVRPGRFVLFVSSLNPFKRPERAVEAVARIRSEHGEEWPVVLAGRASPEHTGRVITAARACGAEDLTRIAGTVGRADLAALYTAARAMVYPSIVETFGLPPLEAMACGCPVVAADRTSIPEIVGDAAVLVDPDDVDGFARELHRTLHDETLRAGLIERGRERCRRFRWSDAAAGTLDLLEEAAAARGR